MARSDSTPSLERLRDLTLASGPPGAEDEVRELVKTTLSGVGTLSFDRLGSLLCEKTGSSATPRVALDAHLDEVAFMVQSISSDGRLKFVALGGWWGHVLPAQRVDILSEDGKKIPGVISSKPPHFLSAAERDRVQKIDDLAIDVGTTSRKATESLGIRIGDPVVPHAEFVPMGCEDILSSKAFDNRAGVGILCETLLRLADLEHKNTVIGIGAVQEELGCRGATTAATLANPDVALVLEGTPADDVTGHPDKQAALGKGPQVRLYDPTAVSNRRLVGLVREVAEREGIPIQLAVRTSGGTDASRIHLVHKGVPTVVIAVPARYIHTHVSLIHWQDYCQSVDLATALVGALDETTVEELIRF